MTGCLSLHGSHSGLICGLRTVKCESTAIDERVRIATRDCDRTAPIIEFDAAENHGHKPGAHGGIIVSLGRDSYHVEVIFANNGALRLYTLGKDENRILLGAGENRLLPLMLGGTSNLKNKTLLVLWVLHCDQQRSFRTDRNALYVL